MVESMIEAAVNPSTGEVCHLPPVAQERRSRSAGSVRVHGSRVVLMTPNVVVPPLPCALPSTAPLGSAQHLE